MTNSYVGPNNQWKSGPSLPQEERASASVITFPWSKNGVAVDNWQFLNDIDRRLITRHYNHLVPELCFKPERLFIAEGVYNWGPADTFMAKAVELGMTVRLHCLYWSNMPAFFFVGTWAQAQTRITTAWTAVRDRYLALYGANAFWAVEALNECFKQSRDAVMPFKDSATPGNPNYNPAYTCAGQSAGEPRRFATFFVQLANDLWPNATIVINDGFMDWITETAQNVDQGITYIRANLTGGATIDAMASQCHMAAWQTEAEMLGAQSNWLNISLANSTKAILSEIDWTLYPGAGTADYGDYPPPAVLQAQYGRVKAQFGHLRTWDAAHPGHIIEVSRWGVTDAYSYANDIPSRRIDQTTGFDRDGIAKQIYYAQSG